jgi:hypothetical protein
MVGCAGVNYRERSTLSHTCYATIENYGDEEIMVHQVDGLLKEVAEILSITLDPAKPRVRIVVRPSSHIQALAESVSIAGYGSKAGALYFTGANLVMIPYYSRTILGHELAHYLTDHYLKSTPRQHWERIARTAEQALPIEAPRDARAGPWWQARDGGDELDACRLPAVHRPVGMSSATPGNPIGTESR